MISAWGLPQSVCFGERTYAFHADYRDIMEIFSYLEDPDMPEHLRWQVALALFYEEPIPAEYQQQAMEYLAAFINCGKAESGKPSPKLLDWEQDAPLIVADVNKVASKEIRALKFVHWWTFMGWFHSIGEGNLSLLVTVRDKLRRGKKLEPHEQEFYRRNRSRVQLRPEYTPEELADAVEKVTLDQVVEAACQVKLDSIYTLRGKEG